MGTRPCERLFLHLRMADRLVTIVVKEGRPDGRTPRKICSANLAHHSIEARELHHHMMRGLHHHDETLVPVFAFWSRPWSVARLLVSTEFFRTPMLRKEWSSTTATTCRDVGVVSHLPANKQVY